MGPRPTVNFPITGNSHHSLWVLMPTLPRPIPSVRRLYKASPSTENPKGSLTPTVGPTAKLCPSALEVTALNALDVLSVSPVPPRAPIIKGPDAKEFTATKSSKRLVRMYVSNRHRAGVIFDAPPYFAGFS